MSKEIFDKAKDVLTQIEGFKANSLDEVEQFRIKYIGSKGLLKNLSAHMREIPNESKRDFGQLINAIKTAAGDKVSNLKSQLASEKATSDVPDLTAPGYHAPIGSRHPVSIIRDEIISIFSRIGFNVEEGPEVEDDWHNFTALNTPADHPARDMQDTFYIDAERLLRTHTSSAQIRVMEQKQPPIRIITPGRVYRNETISARAHCTFHQVEGLYIDKDVSFADLKQTLLYFAQEMFGASTDIRLRPSFFPFTEPSAELDISCLICKTEGCAVCKYTGWVEILGCGMVDPNVLENCKIDPDEYTGFAFGMGVERQAMLKYQINDIRLFWENDLRFLKQFQSA